MKPESISKVACAVQYREYERSARERAERAGTERERKSYLEIASGWANLAAQLEHLYGETAQLRPVA